jgi:ATP-binding cassette subfamily B protein
VLPPCIATVAAIALIGTVSPLMAGGLIVVAGLMVFAMFRLAAAGKHLHGDFANRAAAVDGEMVDVINNMPLVRAFCGLSFEHNRFDATVNRELTARRRSLRYLEKLRMCAADLQVRVIRVDGKWDTFAEFIDKDQYPDCLARVVLFASELRSRYDLED